ncbi:MAG: hypothetical protein AAGF81_13825 [Pseudomonadota bacterium]
MDARPDETIRNHFLNWQCRLRQIAMRQDGGRPAPGMRPQLLLNGGEVLSPGVIIVMVPREPEESTDFFRFQCQKTHDPAQVYEKGLQFLQGTHFQQARTFNDELTALFENGSKVAETLVKEGECLLSFEQFSQRYKMFCAVRKFEQDDPEWQATYWHNRLFNPSLASDAQILGFKPDWSSAQADPDPR